MAWGVGTENVCSFWHKVSGCHKFHYIDICSLYQYVNSSFDCRFGHLDEIFIAPISDATKDSQTWLVKYRFNLECDRYDSIKFLPQTAVESNFLNECFLRLINCLVIPPGQVLLPVSFPKFASKLFFLLCKSCVEVKHAWTLDKLLLVAECVLDDNQETVFWCTFGTTELQLGLLKGYRISDVSEVWWWKKKKPSKELFRGCIDTFPELKTEANVWPTCLCKIIFENQLCRHKLQFLQEYEQRKNIKLEPSKLNRNEGLRLISKTNKLIEIRGYLGMLKKLSKLCHVKKFPDVVKFLTFITTKALDAALVGDDLMLLQYQTIGDAADVTRKSKLNLASIIPANASVILYNYLSKIKNLQRIYTVTQTKSCPFKSPSISQRMQIFKGDHTLARWQMSYHTVWIWILFTRLDQFFTVYVAKNVRR